MAPRGLSIDEKRDRMVELLMESETFFTLKELEKLAPKQKGITQQTVKEVLDMLADDNRIHREKIGGSNYYYCFASQATVDAKNAAAKVEADLETHRETYAKTQEALQIAKQDRQETTERAAKLAQLQSTLAQRDAVQAELEKYGDQDPRAVQRLRDTTQVARSAAIAMTDNISVLISYARDTFGADSAQIRAELELPDDFEDLESVEL